MLQCKIDFGVGGQGAGVWARGGGNEGGLAIEVDARYRVASLYEGRGAAGMINGQGYVGAQGQLNMSSVSANVGDRTFGDFAGKGSVDIIRDRLKIEIGQGFNSRVDATFPLKYDGMTIKPGAVIDFSPQDSARIQSASEAFSKAAQFEQTANSAPYSPY